MKKRERREGREKEEGRVKFSKKEKEIQRGKYTEGRGEKKRCRK